MVYKTVIFIMIKKNNNLKFVLNFIMKKHLFIYILYILLGQSLTAQQVSFFEKGDISTNNNHTGNVWLKEINTPDSIFNYSVAHAIFETKATLNWHIHPGGQILLVTDGVGYYQEKGKPGMVIKKGMVIKCPPGVEHWHGASFINMVSYLATTPAQNGKTIWLQPVTAIEYNAIKSTALDNSNIEKQNIINLSNKKWIWMADKNIDSLQALFSNQSVFVHMGGSWGKQQELDIIKSGGIWYKQADVQETSAQFLNNTAIVLNKIRLTAVVGGNEVINNFMVTEVYVKENDIWLMGSLSFTKLL
jgi:4-carboxymuconolactone decarboxylase